MVWIVVWIVGAVEDSPDLASQGLAGEGLAHERDRTGAHAMTNDRVVGVARGVEHLGARVQLGDRGRDLDTVGAGEHDVGDDQIERGEPMSLGQGAVEVEGDRHLIAETAQDLSHQPADRQVVLDDEQGLAPTRELGGAASRELAFVLARVGGQEHAKASALTELALDADMAAALLDDPEHGREPEPGPFAALLGREEGFEDVVEELGRDAGAGVGDLERDVGAGLEAGWAIAIAGRELALAGGDGQGPAPRHRVAGVDGQVHDDLLDLARIDMHAAGLAAQHQLDHDVLADQPGQHSRDVADQIVEIEALGLEHLLAAEGEQLAGQLRGSVGGLADVAEALADRRVVAEPEPLELEHAQIAGAEDDREDVVEVVGDAAREGADGLQLLGLA